jgi:predicted RNA-binding protein with TRAM domain
LGREGDGIGYVNGFVIIVPGTGIGDWVTVEIDEVHDTFAVASVTDEFMVGETGSRLR